MSRDSDNENSRLGRDGPPMQRTSSPSGGGRVDIERLAAFVDGRCAPAEHQEVLRQLAGSPDDLELVADIEALRDEEAREEEPPQVIPLGSRRRSTRWRRWWPLAAAAAVAFVAIPLTKGSSDASRSRHYADLVRADLPRLAGNWPAAGHPVLRGDASSRDGFREGVVLGMLMMDLRLLMGTDTAAARHVAIRIVSESKRAGVAAEAVELLAGFVDGRTNLSGEKFDAVDRQLAGIPQLVDPIGLSSGAWLRAGWIAVSARDATFFADTGSQREAHVIDERLGVAAPGLAGKMRPDSPQAWTNLASALESSIDRLVAP